MKQEVKQQIYECETQCMKMKNDNIQLDNEWVVLYVCAYILLQSKSWDPISLFYYFRLKVCAEAKAALQVSLKESIEKSNSLIDNVKEKEKALALLQTEKFELQRQQSLLSDALLVSNPTRLYYNHNINNILNVKVCLFVSYCDTCVFIPVVFI